MGWAKFDDQFTDHPKVVAAGPWAELLFVRGVIHCARYETDGFIQEAQLPRLGAGIPSLKRQVSSLIKNNLWKIGEEGWWVHDFLDYHPSAKHLEQERAAARERMARRRASSENVQANIEGTSGVVREKFNDPDPSPSIPKGIDPDGEPSGATLKSDPEILDRLCGLLADSIAGHTGAGKPKISDKWRSDLDLLLRRGPTDMEPQVISPERVEKAIGVVFSRLAVPSPAGFCWADQVRSPGSLRRHWTQLLTAARASEPVVVINEWEDVA